MERALRLKLPNGRFDNVSVGQSSRMRAIKDKGNRSTEVRARAILVRCGTSGWVLHPGGLPGKPDFYFLRSRVVLFVDGCYWHGCAKCRHAQLTNRAYWSAKIQGNIERDRSNNRRLRKAGLRVMRVWEHELKLGCKGPWIRRLKRLLTDEMAPAIDFGSDHQGGQSADSRN
jgi:DNA mismatch endonuclease, patch repair protein